MGSDPFAADLHILLGRAAAPARPTTVAPAPRAPVLARSRGRQGHARSVADYARTDKFHLCREFSREFGLPPYAFLTQARVVRASILLRRSMAPSDVASRVGFCDQSQMHRHFVRIVGCTPGIYAGTRMRKHFVLP